MTSVVSGNHGMNNRELCDRAEQSIRDLCIRGWMPIRKRTRAVMLLQDLCRRVVEQEIELKSAEKCLANQRIGEPEWIKGRGL
jgi:hypothetical protein